MKKLCILFGVCALGLHAAEPPIDITARMVKTPGLRNYTDPTVLAPDGALESFFRVGLKEGIVFFKSRSKDDGVTWSPQEVVASPPPGGWGGPMPLVDGHGELHFVIPKQRGSGRKPAEDLFVDLYHMCSTHGRKEWTEPKRIFEGYVGSLNDFTQLQSGRLVVPFGAWQAGVPAAPPCGANITTCVYSDDNGVTWQRSPSRLVAPGPENTNGNIYGAVEPVLIQLRDGRVWMLIRTETGFLYESFSRDGAEWTPAQPSRFHSSHSPAYLLRLRDGRLVVFWNNCEVCPRVGKDGVYGGRDALHAAISSDEGQTWSGYREVYRDATRNASPPKNGDRGTAYPNATETSDGQILLVSGQGAERRRRFLIDPGWLLEKSQHEDFASLDTWHVFKGIGKPVRYWRGRVPGPELIVHPDKPAAHVLHVRRADEHDPDGATWNFPAGKHGALTLRLRTGKTFGGAQISLTDRMFDPCDDNGESRATFALRLDGDTPVSRGEWHTVQFQWDVTSATCVIEIDGKKATTLTANESSPDGVSYLRLRSTARTTDAEGFMVESVSVNVGEGE